jgi:alkanesulfonate monooxygenase SsuD/methylene tetrahydromethanopterin reductase-like flavin-dependent oxidoreductase (luciferase family)
VLSSADPVKLFQSFATLDLLSNGRAELMAGRGSFIESFPLYGYDLADYDALFEEKLDLLVQLNQQETITWKGRFRPALEQQQVLPRPFNGRLNMWVAVGGTPESVVRAARLGLPVMFAIIGGKPAHFKSLFDYYREAWVHFGHDINQLQVGVHMHAFFGKNNNELSAYYYPLYAAQMNRVGRSRGWPPYQKLQFEAGRTPEGHLLIGEANEAIEKILMLHELFGLTRFSAHMDVGGPSHEAMLESIDIYGGTILPAVRKHLQGA